MKFNEMNDTEKDAYKKRIVEFSDESLKLLLDESEAWVESKIKVFEEYLDLLGRHGKFSSFLSDNNVLSNPQRLSLRTLQKYWDSMCMLTFGSKTVPSMAEVRLRNSRKPVVVGFIGQDQSKQDQQNALAAEIAKYGDSMPTHFSEWRELMSPTLKQMTDNCQINLALRAKARDAAIFLAENGTADTELIKSHIQMAQHYDELIVAMDQLARQEWEALQRGEYPQQASEETEAALRYIALKEKFEYVDPNDDEQEKAAITFKEEDPKTEESTEEEQSKEENTQTEESAEKEESKDEEPADEIQPKLEDPKAENFTEEMQSKEKDPKPKRAKKSTK